MAPKRPASRQKEPQAQSAEQTPEAIAGELLIQLESDNGETRVAALERLMELSPSNDLNAKLQQEGIGSSVAHTLTTATDETEVQLCGKVVARLAAWREMATQLSIPSCVKTLWTILERHHQDTEEYKKRPPPREETPPLGGKGGKKGKEAPAPEAAPEPGPPPEILDAAIRALTSLSFCNEAVVDVIYEHSFALFVTLLSHKLVEIKIGALRLMLVLSRSSGIRMCFCRLGFIGTIVGILKRTFSGEDEANVENNNPDLSICALQVLRRLAGDPGARHKEFLNCGMLDLCMAIVANPNPEPQPDETPLSDTDVALQEYAMENVRELVARNNDAAVQAVENGIVSVILALLPDPHPDLMARYNGVASAMDENAEAAGTIFESLGKNEANDSQPSEEPQSQPVAVHYSIPQRKTTSSSLQGSCLMVLESLLKYSHLRATIIESSPRLLHHCMLFFMETDVEILLQQKAEAEPVPKTPPKGAKGGKKGKEKDTRPVEEDVREDTVSDPFLPPFPGAVQSAACYCLNELCKEPAVAQALTQSSSHHSVLLSLASSPSPFPYPRDIHHPIALLASTLTTLLAMDKEHSLGAEDADAVKLAELLKSLSRTLVGNCDGKALSVTKRQAARAALGMNEALFRPPVRPPLPSPPPTPPAPLLPTTQFIWDALGRPVMTDGLTLRALE